MGVRLFVETSGQWHLTRVGRQPGDGDRLAAVLVGPTLTHPVEQFVGVARERVENRLCQRQRVCDAL